MECISAVKLNYTLLYDPHLTFVGRYTSTAAAETLGGAFYEATKLINEYYEVRTGSCCGISLLKRSTLKCTDCSWTGD